MIPICDGKREIIINAKARGEKVATIALWTGVSSSCIYNILKKHKNTGTITPKAFPGRQSKLTTIQLDQIKETIQIQSDITLEELIEKLNLPIKKSRLSKVIISMGFSFKKRLYFQKHN